MSGRRGGRGDGEDKASQWFSAIAKEKLDAVRWCILHGGISPLTLEDDRGFTGLHAAAHDNKHKALLVILDVYRATRQLVDAIDSRNTDGLTPLMLAAMAGAEKCVEHLLYYGAKHQLKSEEGLTARDYAVKHKKKAVVELIDDETGVSTSAADATVEEAVDADGLTSTQRSKLRKKQLKEAEMKGVLAAVAAASISSGSAVDSASTSEAAAPTTSDLPALPTSAPTPLWAEIAVVLAEKRRELSVGSATKPVAVTAAGAGEEAVVPAEGKAVSVDTPPGFIDPALWHCSLVNRLELHIPCVGAFPPQLGHLTALQTLILTGCNITELPESIGKCTDIKFLDVSNNELTTLPSSIGKLKKLETLDASYNKLVDISALSSVSTLLKIRLDSNELTSIAALPFALLTRLDVLSVSNNKLTGIPDEIGAVGNSLTCLNVSDNAITELSSGLAQLKEKKLKELKLLPNPIEDKKVLKILSADRPEKMVKELFKHLESSGSGKKGKR